MELQNIKKAILQKRYKRFLADVILTENKELVTAHCPNSGSMMGLKDPQLEVFVEHISNAKNLKYKLKLVKDHYGSLVGVDTMLTNKLVFEGLKSKSFLELASFDKITPEKKFNNSRFDFFLENNKKQAFLEVKNVTLKRENDLAEFPDAKTERGSKHLKDLIVAKEHGFDAYNLYLVQRDDISRFKIAADLDPKYYDNFMLAKSKGVKFLCYNCTVTSKEITINKAVPINENNE